MSTRSDRLSALLYFLPVPGLTFRLRNRLEPPITFKELGRLRYAVALAFGRSTPTQIDTDHPANRYDDAELYHTLCRLADDDFDDVLGLFGALYADGFEPGEPNEILADELHDLMLSVKTMAGVGQWEVMFAFWMEYPVYFEDNLFRMSVLWPTIEGRFSSYDVLRAARDELTALGVTANEQGYLVSHPDMIVRVQMLAWKLGLDAIPRLVQADFLEDSVQSWVRTRRTWGWYESKVRLHHLIHRWVRFAPPKPSLPITTS